MDYREYGSGGSAVVLLHGGPGAPGLEQLARGLEDAFRVLEPYQRGSGGGPLSVALHVADLDEFLAAHCSNERPALVGSDARARVCGRSPRPPRHPGARWLRDLRPRVAPPPRGDAQRTHRGRLAATAGEAGRRDAGPQRVAQAAARADRPHGIGRPHRPRGRRSGRWTGEPRNVGRHNAAAGRRDVPPPRSQRSTRLSSCCTARTTRTRGP